MKCNSKLFFMFLVLFAILTINGVNAADNVMETNISADTSTNDNIMLNTYANEVWVSNDGSDSNSGSEANPYKTLNKGMGSVGDNSCIHLKEGIYTGGENRNLNVNKNLTFIGAGADKTIIDAQKQGGIFNIIGHNTITLINLTFANGKSALCGAIYTENGIVNISDGVSFVNNSVTDKYYGNGGAIYTRDGDVIVSGVNVSFVNNKATNGYGGVIYTEKGIVNISGGVSFVNNSASSGGVIYTEKGIVNISGGVSFVNNSASSGGVIYTHDGDVIVSGVNVSFVNNKATNGHGGAICISNAIVIVSGVNVSFVNNKATNGYGGAIYCMYHGVNVSGVNVSFVNNSASWDGGAIYTRIGFISVSGVNVSFVNNKATNGHGGAIYTYMSGVSVSGGVFFVNNSAASWGGAICTNNGSVSVSGGVFFVNNFVTKSGGAIYSNGEVNVSEGVFFVNNSASNGGAIYLVGGLISVYVNVSFVNNSAVYGGAIYSNASVIVYDGVVSFVNNSAVYGGAIYSNASVIVSGVIVSFVNNSATDAAGAIYSNSGVIVSDCVSFVNNSATNKYNGKGGVIYAGTDGVSVIGDNVSFVNNFADYGGVIYSSGGVSVSGVNVSFVNNAANSYNGGGAIYTIGNVTVGGVGVSFVNNSAIYRNRSNGGAIYTSNGNVNISGVNVSFVNNFADYGGAIVSYMGMIIVSGVNVSFVNNSAPNANGGAIHTVFASIYISGVNVSFVNNSAMEGSAIYGKIWIINGVSFMNNKGSSIVQINTADDVTLSNCSFVNNDATQSVISINNGFLNMNYCIFINNNGDFISCHNLSNNNVDYNYWGFNNNPNSKLTNATAKTWIVIIPTINSTDILFGDSVDLTVEFMSTTDGKTFTKLNKSLSSLPINITADIGEVNPENTVIKDNVAKVNYTSNAAGVETVNINFGKTTLTNLTFNITKKTLNININVDDIIYGEDLIVNVGVTSGATGNVTVKVNGITKSVTLHDGRASVVFTGLDAGNYTVSVVYSGDDNYKNSTNITNFKVVKANSNVNINVDDIIYGEDLIVNVGVTSGATGNVTVKVNGITKSVTLHDGRASVVFTGLDAGNYTVSVVYSGDDNYNSCKVNASFIVSKVSDYNITVNVDEIIAGENATITVYLPDDATGNVTIEINNQKYTQKITSGRSQFTIHPLDEGTYNMTVTYNGDNNYASLSKNINVIVYKNKMVELNVSDIIMFYKDGTRFAAVLTDYKGNPIANVILFFTINGVTYNRTTDVNGYAFMGLNLMPCIYNASVYYNGSDSYDNASKNVTVTIKSTIYGENIVKMYQNNTQFFATFIDSNGKVLANTNVIFNINGVLYARSTNEKGIVKLNINLRPGEYVLTAINLDNAEQKGFYINVKSLIETHDLTKYYQNASKFEAKIYNKDGSLATNTDVTFNINGVFYTRTTNNEGVVSLDINLRPGNYTITTMYGGLDIGNTVKVLPTLETNDLSMKFEDGSKFQVKVLDGQGKPLADQNVTFNVNGVFYHKVTGDDGVASLNINLNPGEYIITSIWNNYQVGNKITIT